MAYKITTIEHTCFPTTKNVNDSITEFNITNIEILSIINDFVCNESPQIGRGYQQEIAWHLEDHLKSKICAGFNLVSRFEKYSNKLNEMPDLELVKEGKKERIFFELEFRPNVEKDLIKFQIGFNNGRLALGVLIVALDRDTINPSYTTMPQYNKVKNLIDELKPLYPLLLIGISGAHV
ncbi:MAG: hypothetical protein WCL14_02995 [Bacteroidota bacterium]